MKQGDYEIRVGVNNDVGLRQNSDAISEFWLRKNSKQNFDFETRVDVANDVYYSDILSSILFLKENSVYESVLH